MRNNGILCDSCKEFVVDDKKLHCKKYHMEFDSGYEAESFSIGVSCVRNGYENLKNA